MAHKRKGQLTVSGEWAKHLRKFFRRKFWKGERKAGKNLTLQERQNLDLTSSKMNRSLWQISGHLFLLLFVCLVTKSSHAQLEVAKYSHGKYGTDKFERFDFWAKTKGKYNKTFSWEYEGPVERMDEQTVAALIKIKKPP